MNEATQPQSDKPHVAIDDEAAFGRTVLVCMGVCAPLVFIATTLLCLPSAGSLKVAALIALIPSFFAVPFFGMAVGLTITQFRQDAHRHALEDVRAAHAGEVERAA